MTVAKTPPCRHCGHALVTRPLGLCWRCYYVPGVRERYPSTSKYAKRLPKEPAVRKLPRKPGEPLYRCLWCLKFRCAAPLRRCLKCQAEYDRAAVGMPEEPGRAYRPGP